MFSKTSEYALRAICAVARSPEQMQTTDEIAAATDVPPQYLRKVLQLLGHAQLIVTQRGSGGGIGLARPSEEIRVLDVVNAVDPIQRIETCPLGLVEHGVALCPMHSQLDAALEQLEQTLRSMTIADLLDPALRKPASCRFPQARRR